jgi:hypothetical protein
MTQLVSKAAMVKTDYVTSPGKELGICLGVIASWAAANIVGHRLLRYILYTSLVINSLGVIAFIAAVLGKAPAYQSASFVFGRFVDLTGSETSDGWSVRASPAYVACIGAVMALTNFTGYDASAHISEETRRASSIAPLGIIISVGYSAILGFALILALLFTIQDFDVITLSPYNQPVLASLIDLFGKDIALLFFAMPIICCWYAGVFSTMSSSRVIWSFSRDRGIVSMFTNYKKLFIHRIIAFFFQQSKRGQNVTYESNHTFLDSFFSLDSHISRLCCGTHSRSIHRVYRATYLIRYTYLPKTSLLRGISFDKRTVQPQVRITAFCPSINNVDRACCSDPVSADLEPGDEDNVELQFYCGRLYSGWGSRVLVYQGINLFCWPCRGDDYA